MGGPRAKAVIEPQKDRGNQDITHDGWATIPLMVS